LTDLLKSSNQPSVHEAVKLLARVLPPTRCHPEEGYANALQAAALFQKSGNVAGLLASRFEQTYSLQFESKAGSCQSLASEAVLVAHQQAYAALEIQLLLEQAICSNMNREIGPAKDLTLHALALAKNHEYQSLYLRGLMLLATLESEAGNESSAWSAIHEGLASIGNLICRPCAPTLLYPVK